LDNNWAVACCMQIDKIKKESGFFTTLDFEQA
jgi:hypothetical protein